MDKITISSLECYGYHGVFAEENRLGQRYMVDLEMRLDLSKAGGADDLEATIDYATVVQKIKAIVEGESVKLIERLAEQIAARLLVDYPLLDAVQVRVSKPTPPVAAHFSGVAVQIERERRE